MLLHQIEGIINKLKETGERAYIIGEVTEGEAGGIMLNIVFCFGRY